MKKRVCIFVLLLHLFNVSILAVPVHIFTSNNELSNSLINKLYQDENGFIWIATENGLNRYDGYTFKQYSKNDIHSLNVYTINGDKEGNVWIGTNTGVEKYNYKSDSFDTIPIIYNNNSISLFVSSILKRKNGEVWVSSSFMGIATSQNSNFDTLYVNEELSNTLFKSRIIQLYEDNDERVWIVTENKGVLYCKTKYSQPKAILSETGDTIYNASAICSDGHGNILLGTHDQGTFIKHASEDYFKLLDSFKYNKLQYHVKSVIWNKEINSFLIGTDGDGIFYYTIGMKNLKRYDIPTTAININKLKIHDFLIDKNKNLWLGIYQKGVLFNPYKSNQFGYIGPNSVRYNLIGSSSVMSLCYSQDNHLWVGTDNDGLFRVTDNEMSRHYFNELKSEVLQPRTIMDIAEDKNGILWLATYNNGLMKFNPETQRFTKISLGKNVTKRISSVKILNERWLWLTTFGSGAFRYDMLNNQVTHVNDISYNANSWTNCIEVSNEKVWIGTSSGLVVCNQPYKKELEAILIKEFDNKTISNVKLVRDTLLWVGTVDGILEYNMLTKKIHRYSVDNGLPSDVICGLQVDQMGNIWASTQQGLSRYDFNKRNWISFDVNDGLQANEFSKLAICKSNTGIMYFGGINGVSYFDALDLDGKRTKNLPLYITSLKINNKPSYIDNTNSFLKLKALENNLEFNFSTFDYSQNNRVIFYYKIVGSNKEWLHTKAGNNTLNISNLSPGKYILDVYAKTEYDMSIHKFIYIDIAHYWYGTTIAKIIWFLLVLIILYMIYFYFKSRIEINNKLVQVAHNEELKEARLLTFANIYHDINTPMKLIMISLAKLLKTPSEKDHLFRMMYRSCRRIVLLVEQLLDVEKLEKNEYKIIFSKVNIVPIIKQISHDYIFEADKRTISYSFHSSKEEIVIWTDIKIVEKIFQNLLSNAFKSTFDGGEISVILTTEEDHCIIMVNDTGIEITEEDMKHIFESFYVSNSNSIYKSSNSIALNISYSFAKMISGSLKVMRRIKHEGNRFTLLLPLGTKHTIGKTVNKKGCVVSFDDSDFTNDFPSLTDFEKNKFDEYRIQEHDEKEISSILIAEQDEQVRDLLITELYNKYKIYTVDNGLTALQVVIKEKPSLVISGINISGMDGIRLSRRIKQNIIVHDTPVILLSDDLLGEDRINAIKSGATFLKFPFDIDVLNATIDNLLLRQKSIRLAAHREFNKEKQIKDIELNSPDEELLTKVNKIISDELSNPNFNVTMLAERVGISRVHLNRKLTSLVNQTSFDYIKSIRMEQAEKMIKNGCNSIAEVAYAVGYNNLAHFSTSFKSFHGVSPREYEKGLKKVD